MFNVVIQTSKMSISYKHATMIQYTAVPLDALLVHHVTENVTTICTFLKQQRMHAMDFEFLVNNSEKRIN